ncbi:lipid A-modifier LpxR family protein [Brevundimonas sp. M20]|uniref:lipid A-modifier LpxR family protein n=1 Tax=Brevundimonas sp. M20 TaxID=2591463 RepID=UPI001F0F56F1|nr:lipid A-modifier LpxR family protein [Brevundimonas sp. M20]
MRGTAILAGVLVFGSCAASAVAGEERSGQVAMPDPWTVTRERPATVSDLLTRMDRDARFAEAVDFEDTPNADAYDPQDRANSWAVSNRDVWFEGGAYNDRLRLRTEGRIRRIDGAPLPPGPLDVAAFDAEHYEVSYTRGWTENLGRTPSGLSVTLTPHIGVGVGSRGGSTEAGATLRIGRDIGDDLEALVPEGQEAFGERQRWYLYIAGSGRAVGYNFARTRDGDYARSGVSHDAGDFMGDASIGVAIRRGPVQGSIGLVYREIESRGLRLDQDIDAKVDEGMIAFQISIKPE